MIDDSPDSTSGDAKPTYQCGQCGKSYSRLEYVRRHERKHQDSKPFPCPECAKSFARSDVLLRHRRRCHPGSFDGTAQGSTLSSSTAAAAPSSTTNAKAARKASAAPYSVPSASLFLPASPQQTTAPSPATRSASLGSASNGDSLASYSSLEPPGGYPLTNVWPEYPLGPPEAPANGSDHHHGMYSGRQRQDMRQVEFQLDPSLSNAGGQQQLPSAAWAPTDHSPSVGSTDSPLTSSSGSAPTPPQGMPPSTLPPGATEVLPPLPSPSSFFPPFSASSFFNPAAFPPGSSGGGGGSVGVGGYFPAPSPLGQGALPFSPGQFLSQFNFGDGAGGSSGGLLSPGAENHPEAGFLFDGLLSPNSLLPLPLPEASTPNGSASNFSVVPATSASIASVSPDEVGYEKLREMELEEQRLIEGGAGLVPERKMLHSEGGLRAQRSQANTYTVHPSDPFYIDPQKFGGCYAVEHWQLPPLRILSKVAKRTINQVIPHLPFIHVPSFSLSKVPGCVGFAISSCGRPLRNRVPAPRRGDGGQAVGPTDGDDDGAGNWDGLKSVVRTEKTDMLVRSFTRSRGVLFTEYNVGLLQALLLYSAPSFLSDSQEQRMHAHMQLATIISIARQVGIFDDENEHVKTPPTYDWQEQSIDAEWRKWIKGESARRTAWIIFVLDTVASLETGCPRSISALELADFPLPSPDTIWLAPNANAWAQAVAANPAFGKTLATGLGYLFIPPGQEEPACLREAKWQSGPFFWLCLVLTITREVVELGEGKRRALAGEALRWAWWAKDVDMPAEIGSALERWRRGWDFDTLTTPVLPTACEDECGARICPLGLSDANDSPDSFSTGGHGAFSSASPASQTPASDRTSSTSAEATNPPYADVYFCREALPYFWFSKMLLGMLTQATPSGQSQGFQPGVNQFRAKGVSYRSVLESARVFSRAGEGLM